MRPGWNRLELGLRDVRSLRVRIARVVRPPSIKPNPGGLRELRIPGVRVTEALRPPVLAERALAGQDLSRTELSYLFERTTGDDPFRRDPRRGSAGAGLVRDRLDGERGLERVFSPPAARSWGADGWATIAPDAPDSAIDRLAGVQRAVRVLGPVRGPAGGAGIERLRRDLARLDRVVRAGPPGVDRVDPAAVGDGPRAAAGAAARAGPAADDGCGSAARRSRWPATGR